VDVTTALQGGSLISRATARFGLGLPIGPGVTELEEIVPEKPTDFRELKETFLLDTSGRPSTLRVQVVARGREADMWRHALKFEGETHFARGREQFYQRHFSGLKRVGSLEWQDDRERNELQISEVFDVQGLVLPLHNGRIFFFRLWAHSIHSLLGFAETEKRKHPWALPYPCHQRHIIEIDSSGLPMNLVRTSRVESQAFRFTCHVQQRQGFASVSYDLQITKDHVAASDFELHKTKVREVWPYTVISGDLPRGSMVPWKSRAPNKLLPRKNAVPSAPPKRLPADVGDTPPPLTVDEAKIAPALVPAANPAQDSTGPRLQPAGRTTPTDERSDLGKIQRPNPPPLSEAQLERPRRSRSRRRQRNQRRELIMFACIFVGAAILLAMFIFLMKAK
jgi:hypothetical protein